MILPNVNSAYIQKLVNNPRFKRYINRPLRIVSTFDIPYLAGYSKDGGTVFFDRHFRPFMPWKGKSIDTRKFITLHEIGEKALMSLYGFKYQAAHHIITHFELAMVKAAGIDPRTYTRFLKPQIKGIYNDKIQKVPKNLDLEPYVDEHERAILASLQQGTDTRSFTRRISPAYMRRKH